MNVKSTYILRGSYNMERVLTKCRTCSKMGLWGQCYTCWIIVNYRELPGGGYKKKF